MHKGRRILYRAFGGADPGWADLPNKSSSRRLARLVCARGQGGCSYCFPHGWETLNATHPSRSWKVHRLTQYRTL